MAITGHGGSTDLTLAPSSGSLTFTTGNWNPALTVTVSAAEDSDAANDTATLSHVASGGGYGSETADVGVTVTDNDTLTPDPPDPLDQRPTFGNASVASLSWVRDAAIALTLPAATGGALTYTLTPDPPEEVRLDAGARRLAGTPARLQGAARGSRRTGRWKPRSCWRRALSPGLRGRRRAAQGHRGPCGAGVTGGRSRGATSPGRATKGRRGRVGSGWTRAQVRGWRGSRCLTAEGRRTTASRAARPARDAWRRR